MNDRPDVLMVFEDAFKVDPCCGDRHAIYAGLEITGRSDPLRVRLIGAAADQILETRNSIDASEMCKALFEAHFGYEVLESGFFDNACNWLNDCLRSGQLAGQRALSTIILHWARLTLGFPAGFSDEDVDASIRSVLDISSFSSQQRDQLIHRTRTTIAVIVVDRFCRLLLKRPMIRNDRDAVNYFEPGDGSNDGSDYFHFTIDELNVGIDRWRLAGVSVSDINGWMHYLCTSFKSFGISGMEPLTRVAHATVEMLWPSFWTNSGDLFSSPDTLPTSLNTECHTDAIVPLNWWLHGVSHEPNNPLIPYVVDSIWHAWEKRRARLAAKEASTLDYDTLFATARYGSEALAGYLQKTQNKASARFRHASQLLSLCLERYSSRIAINHLLAVDETTESLSAVAETISDSCVDAAEVLSIEDQSRLLSEAKCVWPFPDPKLEFPEKTLSAETDVQTCCKIRSLITDAAFVELAGEHCNRKPIPRNTALLGLYDLPRCHDSPEPGQQIVTFEIAVGDQRIVIDPIVSKVGEQNRQGAITNPAGTFLEVFDRNVFNAFDSYSKRLAEVVCESPGKEHVREQKLALVQLARQLLRELVHRHNQVNQRYGELIDRAIQNAVDKGVEHAALSECDLIVIPRGMAATSPIDLLGNETPLFSRFRSITTSPSRAVFTALYDRAKRGMFVSNPCVGVSGFEAPVPGIESSLRGKMVRHLVRQINEKIRPIESVELLLAAEQPVASLAMGHAMMNHVDLLLLFGHGAPCVSGVRGQSPFGIQLADGAFPDWRYSIEGESLGNCLPNIVLACACYGGRFNQDIKQSDALSPFSEELLMSIAFVDQPMRRRMPSLIGGFVHQIPGVFASDVLIEMLGSQLNQVSNVSGKSVPGFQFAKQRIDQILQAMKLLAGSGKAMPDSLKLTEMLPAVSQESLQHEIEDAYHLAKVALRMFSLLSFQLCGVEPVQRRSNL